MTIKFDRSAKACSICGRAFEDKEAITTALNRTEEDEVFFRHDICGLCWPAQDQSRYYCFWANEFSANFRPMLLDADTLWQIFARSHLKAFEDGKMAEFACVSALALMRLKQLVLEDNGTREGQATMIFRTRGAKRSTFEVPDCNLDEQALTRVQEELEAFLDDSDGDDTEALQDGANDDEANQAE